MLTLPPGLRHGSRHKGSQALMRKTDETRALPCKASPLSLGELKPPYTGSLQQLIIST